MEYQMQNSSDLLAQLNKLPSPSMVDPHTSTTTTSSESSLTYPNPFESEKSNGESSVPALPSDDKIKSIMSMYPGSEPKTQEPTSWRPPSGYPSLDSWPTYQVSPKTEPKPMASPVASPIQTRPDTTESKPTTETTSGYASPQYPSYASPKPEVRSEQTQQPNYGSSASSYQANPTTSTTTNYSSPSTPAYQSTQSASSTGFQMPSTNYQVPQQQPQASTNHVVQYPLYQQQQQQQQTPYTQSSTSSTQSPQVLLSQIERLQQQNQQQQQVFQQYLSQQMQMQKQLTTIQQTESVTKDVIDKMQANFTKIMGVMESVDQRLSNLEKVTQSILHNQNNPSPVSTKTTTTTPVSTMPHPPAIAYPSYAVPMPSYGSSTSSGSVYPTLQTADEADAVRKIEQFEEDQKLAKRLQEELELEAKRSSSSSSSKSSSTTTKKPTTTTTKRDDESAICPICSTQISLSEIESHADKCLESSSTTKKDSNGQPTPQEKAGFFAKLFGSKDATATPTPAPAPVPVATKPTTTTPAKPTTTTATTTTTPAMQPATVAHMPTAFQPGPGNPNGQFYQMPYAMYNTGYAPYGYSQYPPPGTGQQQGYYYYPGQQPQQQQPPKKN